MSGQPDTRCPVGRPDLRLAGQHTGEVPPTTRPATARLLWFLRYLLPALVCATGVALAAARGFDDTGLDTMSAMFGAGGSIYLMNLLMRVGLAGDEERDAEDEARAFFDRHGRWPDEDPAPGR